MRPAPAAAERPASAQLSKTLARGQTLQVVATTDGGPAANHAVLVAAQLAHAMRASLKVLVVANEREGAAHAQQLMAATHGLLENQSPRPEFAPLVGYTDDVVLQYLEKHPAGLLVVGPFQDRGAGTQSAIGPSAQRIVQQTGSSVLVVKGRRSSFTRVLVCADVDDDAAVQAGSQLAALLHANLDVVHVIAPPAAAYLSPGQSPDMSLDEAIAQGTRLSSVLQGWLDILSADGFDRSSLSLRRGNMPEKALELAHSGNYDLVVVGSRSSSGHFTGSAANNMVRYAECSVLIVRGKV
jgi:nucleotide-binding universal stress UspA family protein